MKPLRIWMKDHEEEPGSVCCLVRARMGPQSLTILSVAHVLAPLDTPHAAPGTEIMCEFDGGEKRKVAQLLDWVDVRLTGNAVHSFDAAIAVVLPGEEERMLRSVPLPTDITGVIEENWHVSVIGAKSGLMHGAVKQRQLAAISLTYQFPKTERIALAHFDPTVHFATNAITVGGDSGAPCLDKAGRLMGMLVGGSRNAGESWFAYIRPVLDRFGVDPVFHRDHSSVTSTRTALSGAVSMPTVPPPAAPAPAPGEEADTLARTMWGEARGEVRVAGPVALEGVAWAVVNRADHPRVRWWGKTIEEVCLKPWQFSCWNRNDPNRRKLLEVDASDPIFAQCLEIAGQAVERTLPADPTNGATHYHTTRVRPDWSVGKTPSARIGNHLFYNAID